MGRKPKPTKLRTTDKHKAVDRPTFTDAEVKPPNWLSRVAKAHWRTLAPELAANQLLSVVDAESLGQLCQAYADYREAVGTLNKEGKNYKTKTGMIRPHPAVKQQKDASELYYKLAREFGINPAARCRVTTETAAEADELDSFLEGAA